MAPTHEPAAGVADVIESVTSRPARERSLWWLFTVSVFLLFVEIFLIRWISTEIRVFAYFKNLTLIACFFGMGLGCLMSARRWLGFWLTFPLLALLAALIVVPDLLGSSFYPRMTKFLGDFNEMAIWTWSQPADQATHSLQAAGLSLAALVFLFVLICLVFVPGGALMGRLFDAHPNRIAAYSTNIAGSLVGIWCFSLVSYASLPPAGWFITAAVLGALVARTRREIGVMVLALVVVLALLAGQRPKDTQVVWSPYQKLRFQKRELRLPDGSSLETGFILGVNGTFYQHAVNLSAEFLRSHPAIWPDPSEIAYMSYNLAYRFAPHPDNVLIVGAGTGNDAAAALRNGARHVDAVEIDPEIVRLGRLHHPERPYDDERVTVHIDDARSFLGKTKKHYDLIVFGALDSHTLTSSFSNIRIDNYVYTVESFRQTRRLLTDRGLLWVVFSVESPFIEQRIRRMLELALDEAPFVFINRNVPGFPAAGGGSTFVSDRAGSVAERLSRDAKLREATTRKIRQPEAAVEAATDDWPYLYLERRTIPTLYLVVMVSILLVAGLLSVPVAGGIRKLNPAYFLLGAGFLLIEVQSISKLSLLFGTTWLVNSVVITGILTMILIANLIAARRSTLPLWHLYLSLGATIAISYFFPLEILLGLGAVPRGVIATLIQSAPIFFAGLIFIGIFRSEPEPHAALASNLLGAVAGGLCESLSFLIGIKALGLVAAGFYAASWIWAPRGRTSVPKGQ